MTKPLVSLVLVTYNSTAYIRACLTALKKVTYRPLELVVVDNRSQDQTVSLVKKTLTRWPYQTRIVTNHQNFGYAKANNIGVDQAKGKYVFILNPDVVVKPDLLQPLVDKAESNAQIMACQPTVYLLQDQTKLNLTGKITHFLGFDWIKDYLSSDRPNDQELSSFSGSGVLLRRDLFRQLGGFDEQYFMYYEDSDLSWRARLAGYHIWYVADSEMSHDYKFEPDESYQQFKQKFFYTERNRINTIIKNYSKKSLILIAPALFVVEFFLLGYCFYKGWFDEKKRSYIDIWRHRFYVFQQRGLTQKLRRVSDRELTEHFVSTITFSHFAHPVVKYLLNPLLFFYWKLIRLFL